MAWFKGNLLCNARHCNGTGGNAWTIIEADSLTEDSVYYALKSGRFVATSGPAVSGFGIEKGEYYVAIDEPYKHFQFTTTFFGCSGVLAEIHGRNPRYKIVGDEKWIRARSFCSSGRYLWTQPILM